MRTAGVLMPAVRVPVEAVDQIGLKSAMIFRQSGLGLSRRSALRGLASGGIAAGLMASSRAVSQRVSDALSEAAVLRDPDIPAMGNPLGDVTIVDYFDYQCPYCRRVDPELQQVVQDDGKVRLVMKDWPVLGGVSIYAARMALATKYQDRYAQAHDALIGVNSRLTEMRVRDVLTAAGIDADRAARDLETNAEAISAILKRNADQAQAFGFRGTPSFIVGKFRVPGVLTMAQFEQAIADARKSAASQ